MPSLRLLVVLAIVVAQVARGQSAPAVFGQMMGDRATYHAAANHAAANDDGSRAGSLRMESLCLTFNVAAEA
jgi:hypothetical protein